MYQAVRNMKAINYGTKGYSVFLPAGDKQAAADIMNNLVGDNNIFPESLGIIDGSIRAIAVTFNTYNTHTRLVTVSRMLIEMLETSNVVQSAFFYTIPLPELFGTTTNDKVRHRISGRASSYSLFAGGNDIDGGVLVGMAVLRSKGS
jgi:hypothetical protein